MEPIVTLEEDVVLEVLVRLRRFDAVVARLRLLYPEAEAVHLLSPGYVSRIVLGSVDEGDMG